MRCNSARRWSYRRPIRPRPMPKPKPMPIARLPRTVSSSERIGKIGNEAAGSACSFFLFGDPDRNGPEQAIGERSDAFLRLVGEGGSKGTDSDLTF